MNQFRIGACYRQRAGQVVRLNEVANGAGIALAVFVEGPREYPNGLRHLKDGALFLRDHVGPREESGCDLVPGELIQRDGQWVSVTPEGNPISEQKAATTYEDVKARVIALAKISRETAMQALSVFEVGKAFNLRPDQWLDFVQFADGCLAVNDSKQYAPADPNASMLARDAAAISRKQPQAPCEPRKAAKPFPLTLSPDLTYAGHQVSPHFGSALLGMDRG